jgi:hypothetical protein
MGFSHGNHPASLGIPLKKSPKWFNTMPQKTSASLSLPGLPALSRTPGGRLRPVRHGQDLLEKTCGWPGPGKWRDFFRAWPMAKNMDFSYGTQIQYSAKISITQWLENYETFWLLRFLMYPYLLCEDILGYNWHQLTTAVLLFKAMSSMRTSAVLPRTDLQHGIQ